MQGMREVVTVTPDQFFRGLFRLELKLQPHRSVKGPSVIPMAIPGERDRELWRRFLDACSSYLVPADFEVEDVQALLRELERTWSPADYRRLRAIGAELALQYERVTKPWLRRVWAAQDRSEQRERARRERAGRVNARTRRDTGGAAATAQP